DESTLRRMVEDRRRLREEDGMAERVRQDRVTDGHARDVVGERRQQGQGLERRARDLGVHVGQVVVQPPAVEPAARLAAELAGPSPGGVERRPVDVLRRGLEPDPDRHPALMTDSANTAGDPSGAPLRPRAAVIRRPVVTAPCEADETSAEYLAMTPPA